MVRIEVKSAKAKARKNDRKALVLNLEGVYCAETVGEGPGFPFVYRVNP